MQQELVGTVLGDGHYRIDWKIGSGGQGTVYRGMHLTLNIPIAIKVLPVRSAQNETVRTRFAREAQRAATLRHPNIVITLDYAYDDERGLYYIVSEFIQGTDLKKMLRSADGPMPLDQAFDYIRQIGSALQYAHDRNIVHRDIKPANVLIDEKDDRAVLCDFGLARMIEGEDMEVTVAAGGMPGTPTYMSPEQCTGQELDHRTDIYSLGLVAYEMLVGRNPFRGPHDTSESVKYKHVNQPPPPPRAVNPDLSPLIEAALLKALAKAPNDRFQSASDFVGALEGTVPVQLPPESLDDLTVLPPSPTRPAEAVVTVPPPPPRRVMRERRPRRRKRFRLALPLLIVVAILALVVFLVPEAHDHAEGVWNQVTDDVKTLAESSGYFENLWDLLFGESAPRTGQTTPTVSMPSGGTPASTGQEATRIAKTVQAIASDRTRQARTREAIAATASARATRATVAADATSTSPPLAGEVVIKIEGLFEKELYCSSLVLFKGQKMVRRIALEGRRELRFPRRSVDWFRLEGSLDGKCPWTRWRLTKYNPDHIDVASNVMVLKFVRAN